MLKQKNLNIQNLLLISLETTKTREAGDQDEEESEDKQGEVICFTDYNEI
jgi:hypothetical protein